MYLVPALVVVVDVAVGAPAPDEVRHRVGNRAELLAAVPQLLFVALPLGDIERDARDSHRTHRFVAHRAAGAEQPRLARDPGGARGTPTGTRPHRERAARLPCTRDRSDGCTRSRNPGQAHRRIIARANQQAKPGRPVPAVALDLPFPHAGVDTFLGHVEAMVRPLEVALEPERVRQCLFETVAQQADDEGHAREHGEVQHVRHALHASDPRGSKKASALMSIDRTAAARPGPSPPTTAAASTASVNGSRTACSCSQGSSAHRVSATRTVAATATA